MPFWLMPLIWAGAILTFLLIEFAAREMVTLWMAIGSLGGFILSVIPPIQHLWWVQIIVSIVLSLALIASTRKFVNKWMKEKHTPLNIDARIGFETHLLTPITENENGTIQINDIVWNVKCVHPIEAGTLIRIIEIAGSKFIVETAVEPKKDSTPVGPATDDEQRKNLRTPS